MANEIPAAKSNKKAVILGSIAAFALLAMSISALVGVSVRSVTDMANRLDDSRSRSTVTAALQGVTEQLEGVTHDNAVWDDAAVAAYKDNDRQWMIDNWGLTTLDYPLYNEALVIESDGTPVIAYDNGIDLAWTPAQFYGPSFDVLLQKIRRAEGAGSNTPMESAFVMTPQGLSVMSICPILPSSLEMTIAQDKRRYVIFSRQVNTADIAALGESYVVPGLSFSAEPSSTLEQAPVRDGTGGTIGYLSWPSQKPGDTSFTKVVPLLGTALVLLAALLGGFALLSRYLVTGINRDRVRAEHESTHDTLSGLLNRTGLYRQLEEMIAAKTGSRVPTLVYLDLDGFKDVNDSYGHAVGDSLIRNVSQKLAAVAPAGALASRLGGDEFAVLLNGDAGCKEAGAVASEIHRLFKEPFDIDGRVMVIGASIGIALADAPGIDGAELVRQADLAMYRAKDLGRGRTILYETAFDEDRAEQNRLESDLREAIAANDLDVAFQPLVDAKTSAWHGMEALARWVNKRTGERVAPDVFIPLAERSGLIELLGLQVLRKALTASKGWPGLKVSVNVSPAQFRNPAFPEHVARILAETGADPKMLTLEITEGFFVRNPERAQRIVKALKALGVAISLDDFGSGFSSIGYLRQFEFDRLKIDRSFISALDHEANAPNVIQATVALANAFNIPVTAEGIEREEQAVILRLSGCDEFQGFLFGKPMAASEISKIIRRATDEGVSAA